tara:strand:+ start:146 stop:331 length:186 start_codon:yes stop_codon:yes gene_type:complete
VVGVLTGVETSLGTEKGNVMEVAWETQLTAHMSGDITINKNKKGKNEHFCLFYLINSIEKS